MGPLSISNVNSNEHAIPSEVSQVVQGELSSIIENFSRTELLLESTFDTFHDDESEFTGRLRKFADMGEQVAELFRRTLPKLIQDALFRLKHENSFEILHIKGWPIGKIGGTPTTLKVNSDSGFAPLILAGICQYLGGVPTQFFNAISPNVPMSGETPQLGFHRDGCNSDRVSISTLLCLRSNGGGKTVFASLNELLASLSDTDLGLLQEPIVPGPMGMLPALVRTKDRWNFHPCQRFNQTFIESTTNHSDAQIRAIKAFGELAGRDLDCYHGVTLAPGDTLSFANHRPHRNLLLHGRTAYADELEPANRRWVKLMNCEIDNKVENSDSG